MLLLTKTPSAESGLENYYERQAREGMVHSSMMCGERFELADNYNEDWASPAITWAAGGKEQYLFSNSDTITVRSAGALIIAREARYAYAASNENFRSNMITFPRWVVEAAKHDALDPIKRNDTTLATALFLPDDTTQSRMNTIASRCAHGFDDESWYMEQIALLYSELIDHQDMRIASRDKINATKKSTRAELARRVERAHHYMLEAFHNTHLDINELSKAACLSPYHLIRVFKAVTGQTPMRRLAAIRMEAALRLLQYTAMKTAKVANAVGYSDRTAFFKAFKSHYGCAPSAIDRIN
ncbi:helix-turn-helix transcriptional regulator [Hyphococcus flavus]|uniref:Helix-turn-helix transcriptional regulator n=1 Tax=Hyphococcus flavus TaxID=1866326 RepID=A0AAE9ZFZ6_9PROT|nr:helix-turn-helix transcriptional regulator [Hyphococcus flavus]WDI32238.1 helix-turn-helix transcriptional regulator [Hyphococcus flavus]